MPFVGPEPHTFCYPGICPKSIRLEGTERTKLSVRVNNSNANINAAEIVIKLCLDALTVKTILLPISQKKAGEYFLNNVC
jgi:hypothetical protein